MNLDDLLEQSAEIRKHKKHHWTATKIAEIEKWRDEVKEQEEKWQKGLLERAAIKRQIAINAVANQDKEITFSEAERQEIAYRKTRDDDYTYEYKPKYTPGKWNEENEAEKSFHSFTLMDTKEPKPTLIDKINSIVKNLMKSGFDW